MDTARGVEWRLMYDSPCSLYTHPLQLAGAARLAGFEPTPPERARVLEVGCALGGNLTPIAATLPGATCVGIDPFKAQIEGARARAAAARVTNVRYLPIGVEDLAQVEGEFDYIICHGLLSWIPPAAQRATFEVCARRLSPNGLAYISYNTLPRWHTRRYIRDMMRWRVAQLPEGADEVLEARRALDFFAKASSPHGAASPRALYSEAARDLSGRPDYYIAHEYLLEENHAFYLHEVVSTAAAAAPDGHGLTYLADASLNTQLAHTQLPQLWIDELGQLGGDQLSLTQHLDFIFNRGLRRSLWVRADHPRSGGARGCPRRPLGQAHAHLPLPSVALSSVSDVWLVSPFLPVDEAAQELTHRHSGHRVEVRDPLTRALALILGAAWPHALPGAECVAQARLLDEALRGVKEPLEAFEEPLQRALFFELISPPLSAPPRLAPSAPTRAGAPPRALPYLTGEAPAIGAPSPEWLEWREVTCAYHFTTLASPLLSALLPLMSGVTSWEVLAARVEALIAAEPRLAQVEARCGAAQSWDSMSLSGLEPIDILEALAREAHELALLTP